MVHIKELKSGQGNVDVEGVIKEVGEKRTFNKFGRNLVVVNAVLEDDSGNVKLSLWNDDANRFKEGDKIKITNGYVNEFQGEKQLTSGKFGKIEKVGEGPVHKDKKSKDKIEDVEIEDSSLSDASAEESEEMGSTEEDY